MLNLNLVLMAAVLTVVVGVGLMLVLSRDREDTDPYESQARRDQRRGDAVTPGCREGFLDCRQDCACHDRFLPSESFVVARSERLRGRGRQ